jgi:FKBP-type peptidyl-prolyl cis-trans isomerase FklB
MKQLFAITALLVAPLCLATEAPDLSSDSAKINYSVGYQIGGDFKLQGLEMQPETVIRGIQDALSDASPLMTPEEMRITMGDLGKRIAAERTREKYMENLQYERSAGEFMVENAKKKDVKTTASGLQYRIIVPGTGKTPRATDTVTVNYRGTLIDGKEFDSSYKKGKPATFRVDKVIPGWTEALQLMKVGAKWQLFIPYQLAYGDKGQLREKDLIFEVELLSIVAPVDAAADQGAETAN